MKTVILILIAAAFLLQFSGALALAGGACCAKDACQCANGTCCVKGVCKCALQACCADGACKCGSGCKCP